MKKSISSRIKKTKTGKLLRRTMGQSHFKAKQSGKKTRLKRRSATLKGVDVKALRKYL